MAETHNTKFDYLVQLMIIWSEKWQKHILRFGDALAEDELETARCVGIAAPEKVRILRVPNVPLPHHKLLHQTFVKTDIFSLDADGLTLGYGVFLREDSYLQTFWLAHELGHVAQFERLGGFAGYVRQYLHECLTDGYDASSFEIEANQKAVRCLAKKGITYDFFDVLAPDWRNSLS